jgi:hypothetical protein
MPSEFHKMNFLPSALRVHRRMLRSFRESKSRPFETHQGAGTRKIKGWRARQLWSHIG